MLLEGKVVIVTGGNSGIGEAIALAAAKEGAKIVVDYIAHESEAQSLIDRIRSDGGEAVSVRADVSSVDDVHRMVGAAVDAFGRLDVMVNNAGIETRTSVLDTTEEQYDKVLDVNLKSAFFGTQAAAKQFIQQGGGGVVVNISSVHEDWPMPGNTAYCLSKGGQRMLARTAGVELGEHGIRVVNVCPGAVDTPINTSTMNDSDKAAKLKAAIPLGRVAEPSDVADTVVFVASDRGGYITATSVVVDGGIMQGSVGL